MARSKIIINGETYIDLTADTAVASDVASGKTFHLADGTQATGTFTAIVPSGSQTVTQNGTYDVTALASMIVNVSGGSGGLVYETGSWAPDSDTPNTTINWSNTHTSAPMFFMLMDSTGTSDTTTNTNYGMVYFDSYKIGSYWPYSSSTYRYGAVCLIYRATSTTSISIASTQFSYASTNTGSSNATYPRYWVNETRAYVYTGTSSRYWRAGRTYNWIAVWAPGES